MKIGPIRIAAMPAILLSIAFTAPAAHAVPSFARQTGMACEACHTVFPELTPFGRAFKLNGFTLSDIKQITAMTPHRRAKLTLSEISLLSVMVKMSDTHLQKGLPDSTVSGATAQNNTAKFPEAMSIYYAGAVSPRLGAFIQMTYDTTEDHFGLDMADVRYANHGKIAGHPMIYGVSLNNMPSLSDPWQDTPAYWFPYSSSPVAPSPVAATQIVSLMNVVGLGPYLYFPDLIAGGAIYASVEGYRSVPVGISVEDSASMDVISGITPYWRVAWQKNWKRNSLEIGAFGIAPHLYPGMGKPLKGPTNDFRDVALDMQYQYLGSDNIFSVEATGIRENQDWNAFYPMMASHRSDTLNTLHLTGTWYYRRHYGAHLQYFDTWGTRDLMFYDTGATDTSGSINGKPDSRGEIIQFDYLPWENTKVTAQYTIYNMFNGGSSNYDGHGRNASDNDTLYVDVWIAF